MKSRLTRDDLEFLCSVRGTNIRRYGTGIEVHRVDITPEEKEMILDFRADKARKEIEDPEYDNLYSQPETSPQKAQKGKKWALLEKLSEQYSEDELKALSKGYGLSAPVDYENIVKVGKVGKHKIGVFTDTHIGSKYTNSQYIIDALKKFEEEGCEMILHAGDVVEGVSSRPGHAFECSHYGFDAQYKEAVRVFSHTNLDMYFVEGNHSAWVKNSVGADMGLHLDGALDNMHYLGHDMATMKVGSAEIMLWHGIDGSCFTEGTEILTEEHGWIDFKDLTLDMHVATMSKSDHIFEWQKPTEITNEFYSGDVYSFKSRCFDLTVTPNHGMWVKYNQSINNPRHITEYPQKSHIKYDLNWKRMDAKEVHDTWRKQKWVLPNTSNGYIQTDFTESISVARIEPKNKGMIGRMNHVGTIDIKTIASIIGWYVTEGHAEDKFVTISQYKAANPENYEIIKNVVDKLPISKTYSEKSIVLHGIEISKFLVDNCGNGSRDKSIPAFIKNNSMDVLEVVFEALIRGDGHTKNRDNIESAYYSSNSKRLLDDVAEIALKLGYYVTYTKKKGECKAINVSKIQSNPSTTNKPTISNYEGKIYCCSVPNGLIYVRRNGRCLFTHNSYASSYRVQKIIESLQGGTKPNILICGHTHKSLYLFERNIHAISAGCMQFQTPFMRGKKLSAHTGYWIIEFEERSGEVLSFTQTFYPLYK